MDSFLFGLITPRCLNDKFLKLLILNLPKDDDEKATQHHTDDLCSADVVVVDCRYQTPFLSYFHRKEFHLRYDNEVISTLIGGFLLLLQASRLLLASGLATILSHRGRSQILPPCSRAGRRVSTAALVWLSKKCCYKCLSLASTFTRDRRVELRRRRRNLKGLASGGWW